MIRRVIAYQGEPGAYSELAARQLAIRGAAYLPCRRFEDVFDSMACGRAGLAMVPYVNSLAGPVAASCALLARRPVRVLDEIRLRIIHALMAPPGAMLRDVHYAWSHPVALRQCLRFFRRHPWVSPQPAEDTAGAVAEVMAQRAAGTAAIAGAHCAAVYDAEILVEDISDSQENYTQFLLIELEGIGARSGKPPTRRAAGHRRARPRR